MEDGEHLYDLLKDFDTAMLVTRAADGHLHARPMAVAELRADADAYFVTNIDSPKVAEVYADADVLLTFQSAESIRGGVRPRERHSRTRPHRTVVEGRMEGMVPAREVRPCDRIAAFRRRAWRILDQCGYERSAVRVRGCEGLLDGRAAPARSRAARPPASLAVGELQPRLQRRQQAGSCIPRRGAA